MHKFWESYIIHIIFFIINKKNDLHFQTHIRNLYGFENLCWKHQWAYLLWSVSVETRSEFFQIFHKFVVKQKMTVCYDKIRNCMPIDRWRVETIRVAIINMANFSLKALRLENFFHESSFTSTCSAANEKAGIYTVD